MFLDGTVGLFECERTQQEIGKEDLDKGIGRGLKVALDLLLFAHIIATHLDMSLIQSLLIYFCSFPRSSRNLPKFAKHFGISNL